MSEDSKKNKRIAKNSALLSIRMVLVILVSLFTTRVVLHELGVEDYGIYNVVAGFVSMFSFLNTSMSNGIQRFYNYSLGNKDDASLNVVYNVAIFIQLLIIIVLFIILQSLGSWYVLNKMIIPSEKIYSALVIFECSILSLIVVILQVPYTAAIIAYEKMNYFAYLSILEVVFKLLIAFVLVFIPFYKLEIYGCLHLFVTVVIFILSKCYVNKKMSVFHFRFLFDKKMFRQMLSFSGWNVFGTFSYMFKDQGLNLLLNAFFGPIVNAARGISYMILGAFTGFQNNIVLAFRPQLVQSYAAHDFGRVKSLFYMSSKFSFMILALISIPLILDIQFVLDLWLGDDVPQYTATFTVLVIVNLILSSLNTPLSQIIHASGHMKQYQVITSIIIFLNVPISYLFLSLGYSPNIVYFISIGIAFINQIICCFVVQKIFYYSIKDYIICVIKPCVYFVLFVPLLPIVLKLYLEPSFLRLFAISLSTLMSSFFVVYFLILDVQEKFLLIQFFNKKICRKN